MIPCIGIYLLLQKYYVAGLHQRGDQVTARDDRVPDIRADGAAGAGEAAWDGAAASLAPASSTERAAVDRRRIVGAVVPTARATTRLRPIGSADVELTGGLWADRRRVNRERTLGHGFAELTRVGTLENFRLAAGAQGTYRALGASTGTIFPFLDTDVYKWLEAVGWELGQAPDPGLAAVGRRGDRPDRPGPAARRLPQHLRPGRRRADSPTATSPGATSCTASATSSRRRSPGTARSATTGCSSVALARRSTRSSASSGRPDRAGARRTSRDRDGPRRAVPDDRRAAPPRAGRGG